MNGSNNVVLYKWAEVILGISVIVSFIIPHTSTLLLLVTPLLCLFLYIKKKSKSILLFSFIPVLAIIVSLLLNVSGEAGFKAVLSSALLSRVSYSAWLKAQIWPAPRRINDKRADVIY